MSPEYQITLKVDVPSSDELNDLVDQIKVAANPYQISAREIRGRFPINEKTMLFDRQVKSLYEIQKEPLTCKQIAKRLEVSSAKIYSSLRRLKDDGEIEPRKKVGKLPNKAKELELQEFDLKVKPYYITDVGKKLTHQQIVEELGVSSCKLVRSVRRLKDRGEIEDVRKPQPNKLRHGPKIVVKQELRKLIEENPDKHYTLSEFQDQLGGKLKGLWVTREIVLFM